MTAQDDQREEDERIARVWLSYHESEQDCEFWVVEKMLELVFEQPQRAWDIVLRINELSMTHPLREYVDGIVAAGPLEELIHAHGKWLIGKISEQAGRDERLREQLRYIYIRESLDAAVRDKLSAIQG